MTHKEKATEIVSKFMKYKVGTEYRYHTLLEAKQCALIAVDEIINLPQLVDADAYVETQIVEYYKSVRTEIEKL